MCLILSKLFFLLLSTAMSYINGTLAGFQGQNDSLLSSVSSVAGSPSASQNSVTTITGGDARVVFSGSAVVAAANVEFDIGSVSLTLPNQQMTFATLRIVPSVGFITEDGSLTATIDVSGLLPRMDNEWATVTAAASTVASPVLTEVVACARFDATTIRLDWLGGVETTGLQMRNGTIYLTIITNL